MKHIEDHQVADIGHDPLLLESFYREHSQTVRAFLTRRVSTAEDTADLMADVFMAAIDTAHRYRQRDGTAAAWLLGIARNKVADFQRRTARRLRAEHKLLGHRLLDEDATARLEERIEAERLTRALYDALANLPARDRRLMELVAVDGVSIADAAALLGIQPGTARVRLHRSRARLRNHLGDQSVLESIGQDPTVLPAQEVTA